MHLYDVLRDHRATLRDEWVRSLAPRSEAWAERGDDDGGFDLFLGEAEASLRRLGSNAGPLPEGGAEPNDGASGDPGVAVARALEGLHARILALAAERGVEVSLEEQLALASRMNAALRRCLERQARLHTAAVLKLGHDLRNPLGSARMALTLLCSRIEVGEAGRLVELLDRNLLRLQAAIEATVGDREDSREASDEA